MRSMVLAIFSAVVVFPGAVLAQSPESQETREKLKALEDRLNKLEGAPAKTSLAAFNPAMGMALDFAYAHDKSDRGNFLFRAAEINLEAPIDPFLKGLAILTGSPNGVTVEEAALQTTALPYNLTVTGGRLFASFGRLAHFHDHELPVVTRPASLDTYVGGETQSDGLEAAVLFPTPFYLSAALGVYNKMGAENLRADNAAARPLDEFTYLGRLATYADISDDHSLEIGIDSAWTPKRSVREDVSQSLSTSEPITTRRNTWRALSGVDLTYRYQPARGGIYHGVVWSMEVMQNNERRFDPLTKLPVDRVRAYSGLSYVQVKMGRHWRPGLMVDLMEDLDIARRLTRTYTGFLTYDVTEFQRLRLAYSESAVNAPGMPRNHELALQWTGVLGHHVHGFRDR